jgi:hypothetical protein
MTIGVDDKMVTVDPWYFIQEQINFSITMNVEFVYMIQTLIQLWILYILYNLYSLLCYSWLVDHTPLITLFHVWHGSSGVYVFGGGGKITP